MANNHGYQAVMLDGNNPNAYQPTVQAYLDWMSCPQVKGFHNESHGSSTRILLKDGDIGNVQIEKYLHSQLQHKMILFDSCLTFQRPLLDYMTKYEYADAPIYIGGNIELPFGPTEPIVRCIWRAALDQQAMSDELVTSCTESQHITTRYFGDSVDIDESHIRRAH